MFAKSRQAVLCMVLALAAIAAPAAQAESRDSGVSRIIAMQGNQALQQIKAEFRQAFKVRAPVLPARPAGRTVVLTPVNGVAAAVRCSE